MPRDVTPSSPTERDVSIRARCIETAIPFASAPAASLTPFIDNARRGIPRQA
jgi:hypothetical protein